MLQLVSKILCFPIMYYTGYFVIRKIVGKPPKISKTTILYILLLGIVSVFLHQDDYAILYSIIIFLLNIVVYKRVFKIDLSQATICVCILMALLTLSDILLAPLLRLMFTLEQIRTGIFESILSNIMIGGLCYTAISIKFINKKIVDFYQNIRNKKFMINMIYLIILIIGLFYIMYKFASNPIDKSYISNMVILISFSVITYIYIDSKNDYKVLSDEYDVLFNYVQNFEDWIEKEQLNRHEYKNQLAVLRTVAKDKKVKSKIDEILDDNINIEDEVVNKLKDLPKGGLKGLMYYKAAIAKKKNINLVVDVSLKSNSKLKKLDENQMKTLCKLIGIYFDNAIEASIDTKSKYLLLEIYELKDGKKGSCIKTINSDEIISPSSKNTVEFIWNLPKDIQGKELLFEVSENGFDEVSVFRSEPIKYEAKYQITNVETKQNSDGIYATYRVVNVGNKDGLA